MANFVTFGCRVNQADSLGFEEELLARGGVEHNEHDLRGEQHKNGGKINIGNGRNKAPEDIVERPGERVERAGQRVVGRDP